MLWRARLVSLVLVFAVFSMYGCKSIAQKFIRKPKKTSEVDIVVPKQGDAVNPRLAYERHFVFAKVCMDEFKSAMGSMSRKRLRESLDQAVENMQILYDYFPEPYQRQRQELSNMMEALRHIYAQVQQAKASNMPLTVLKNKVEALRRKFDLLFWPSKQPESIWGLLVIR